MYLGHCLIEGRFAPCHSEVVTWCLESQFSLSAFQLKLLFYDVARNGVSFRNIKLLVYESRLHQPVFLNLPCCDFLWTQKEQEISAPMMSDRYISQLLSKAFDFHWTGKKEGKIWNGGFIWKQTEICIGTIYICASFTCQSNYFKSLLYRTITSIIRNIRKVYLYGLLYKEGKRDEQVVNSRPVNSVSMVSAIFPAPKYLSAFSSCSEFPQWWTVTWES